MKRYISLFVLALLALAAVTTATTAGACGTGVWPCGGSDSSTYPIK